MAKEELGNIDLYTARWFNNADAPVTLMIDGLNNSLIHLDPDKSAVSGSDRGHLRNLPTSTFSLLHEKILKPFSDVKATLFWNVDDYYSSDIPDSEIPFDRQFDPDSKEFLDFVNEISALKQISIAYNGMNYFTKDQASDTIVGEYENLASAKEALKKTNEGLAVFEKLLGYRPAGGKFPGFHKNDRSVDGVKDAGLSYWCSGFAPREITHDEDHSAFNLHKFEGSETMHFPASFHGSSNSLKNLDILLERQKVISIIESYSRYSHNGIQLPNLIDDMGNLVALFTYLSDKNVWHASIEEIVTYYNLYHDTKIKQAGNDSFSFESLSGRKFGYDDHLTLNVHGLDSNTDYVIMCPDNLKTVVDNRQELFRTVTLPIREGAYKIIVR